MRSKVSTRVSLDESLNESLCSFDYYKENKIYIQEKAKQETKDDADEIDAIVGLALSLENETDDDAQQEQNKKEELIERRRIEKKEMLEKTIDKAIYIVGCYW